jgi:hypothetical protein
MTIKPFKPRRVSASDILRKLIIAWDADQDLEFDEALDAARKLLGFKLRADYVEGEVVDAAEAERIEEYDGDPEW